MGKRWEVLPLRKKIFLITAPTAAAVVLGVITTFLIVIFGMTGFQSILENDSRSLSFRMAMDAEAMAFESYIENPEEERRRFYEEANLRTKEALDQLPFDYADTGAGRYAKTWSIRNSFETYEAVKEYFFTLSRQDTAYVDTLYDIYEIQKYLSYYAGSLHQMNAEEGDRQYRQQLPFLMVMPVLMTVSAGAAVFAIVWLNRSLNRTLTKPILKLSGEARRIADNDFDGPDLQAAGEDEIGELIRAFVKMKSSMRDYIVTLKEKHEIEKQLDSVQLQLLKNQINPHFLFNTLNMIVSMAQVEEAETTEKMITAMSRLFRYNLKSTSSTMPFERELKVVQDYIYLQQMRFGKRIRCSYDCEPETMDKLIPVFALQPVVENAIVHGLSSKPQGGRIHIRAWLEGDKFWLSVADTGAGIPKVRLEEIRWALEHGDESKTGVGVGNIYRRIHTMYEGGEFQIYSKEGCGTVVQLAFGMEGDSGCIGF